MLVSRRGSRGHAFAAKLESHAELGLQVAGFLDDVGPTHLLRESGPASVGSIRWKPSSNSRIVDEVAICFPSRNGI